MIVLDENVPENQRSRSVCSPKPDDLAVISAYLPDPVQWSADFKRRL